MISSPYGDFAFSTYVSNLLQCGPSRLQRDRIYSVLANRKTKTSFISNVRDKKLKIIQVQRDYL